MSESEKVPTYYVTTGGEHYTQTTNEPAEEVVATAMADRKHVHTWSKDTGTLCPADLCDPKAVASRG